MRVAITQPTYLPWLGYFDLLDQVDVWVCLDNVELSRRSVVRRNRVKVGDGKAAWLSVELAGYHRGMRIDGALLASGDWARGHLRRIEAYYRHAPSLADYREVLESLLPPRASETMLGVYNERLVLDLARLLGIDVDVRRASRLVPELQGSAQDKLLTLCRALEEPPTHVYNFARGIDEGLYDPAVFRAAGIQLMKHDYAHPEYRQLGGAFMPYLSVVDLLLNEGGGALDVIRKGSRWLPL